MTVAANEQSTQDAAFFEIYFFDNGSDTFSYTSDFVDHAVTLESGTLDYISTTLERSGFTYNAENSARQCSITIPNTDPLAIILRPTSEAKKTLVTIYRVFSDDSYENIFAGELINSEFSGGVCSMQFESILLNLDREVCKVRMQALCNNELYDPICIIDDTESTWRLSVIVGVSTDGRELSAVDIGLKPEGFFQYGRVKFGNSYRLITSHVGGSVYINPPIVGLIDGSPVTLYAGCDKHPQTCISRFDNIDNFVGMPYIPLKDTKTTAITNG